MYGCGKDCLILIPLGCHSQLFHSRPSVFLLWLRQLPWCGDQTSASVPPPTQGRSVPTNTPVFLHSSYQVLRGSIYSFPLVRYSCMLSAGVLHAILCLKVYSWCTHGERCIPHPPTPLPSCSPQSVVFRYNNPSRRKDPHTFSIIALDKVHNYLFMFLKASWGW